MTAHGWSPHPQPLPLLTLPQRTVLSALEDEEATEAELRSHPEIQTWDPALLVCILATLKRRSLIEPGPDYALTPGGLSTLRRHRLLSPPPSGVPVCP